MKRLLLLAALLPISAFAATVNVTWVQPTTYEDGSPLPASEIQHYRLAWSVRGVAQPDIIVPVGATYTLNTGTLTGRTCVTLFTVATDDQESEPSNTACKNARPGRPTNLTAR